MELSDTFGIIIKPSISTLSFDKHLFFENLIKNNRRIYLPFFVKSRLNELSDNDIKMISNYLEDYIKIIRKNLRESLKRNLIDHNLLQSLINILDEYNYKIIELEYYINSIKVRDSFNSLIYNNIISDPILQETLKNDILKFDNLKTSMYFLTRIKNLNKLFYNSWCIPFMMTSFNSILTKIDNLEYPIPSNLMLLEKFDKKIKLYSKYTYSFRFLNSPEIFNNFISNIFETLLYIAKESNICMFISILKTYGDNIKDMFKHSSNNVKDTFIAYYIKNVTEYYMTNSLNDVLDLFFTSHLFITKNMCHFIEIIAFKVFDHLVKNNLFDDFVDIIFNLFITNNFDKPQLVEYVSLIVQKSDNKNIFSKAYHKKLMKRLLVNNMSNINEEINIVSLLGKNIFGLKYFYKINKTIDDIKQTNKINEHIYNKIPNIKNWNIIVTSYNTWDSKVFDIATNLNMYPDNMYSDDMLSGGLVNYSKIFYNMYEGKNKINMYFHTGSVDFSYTTNKGKVKLTLLPLQGLVLELFSDKDNVNISDIINIPILSSYSIGEKEKILDVFIKNNILTIDNKQVNFNMELESCILNIIDQFFIISDLPQKWEKYDKEDIVHEKMDIIKTQINHYVKKESLSKDRLFTECSKINVFKLEQELFDKALEYMLNMEYINFDESMQVYTNCIY